ncbi:MAG: polymorphic toxin type 44 domain-containing protein [Alkalibacterium gilvum]|uniref:Toxin 44 n=1 Tax=Alkalibacterium gilvum TaxID=1130080 RepID=A0A1H6UIJ1_9LACT|nr:polymorphic toxin type 44 domain-containing protein [Alkalibacterium gilvum]MDN6294145.1 polymorphic toxin type 44 domain-containing protein [Alkalibacterium sp.]MDN6729902.1 polymorphic toxin type 44 domain-containing protein [Alkalibacterium sp.]SEI92079.1 toxin 44 [Alkalibacterium gilvum]
MNFKKSFILLSTLTLLSPVLMNVDNVSANEKVTNEQRYVERESQNLNDTFLDVYNTAKKLKIEEIQTDEEAYAFLLQNKKYISITSNGQIKEDYNGHPILESLSTEEIETVKNFVYRMNSLVANQAISIDHDLVFSVMQNIEPKVTMRPQAIAIINIMYTTRNNKNTLKSVFNNAPFGTRHAVAGLYFAQRVRTGGAWDMKAQLGTNTSYYIDDLGTTMTGETIGNFHYGYVGRAVFSGATLKSAAGMYQVISGTSSVKYYSSFFDDPRDQAQIQRGIDMYDREH